LQQHLADHFEVWAYDPPGHGRTPAPPGAYLDAGWLASHLAAWLRATRLLGVPLFGHSQGGEVLLHLAVTSPELASHLVLCAPSGREETAPTARLLGHLLLDIRHERPGFLVRVARSYVRTGVRRSWKLLRAGRHDATFGLAAWVHAPVLILEGELDRVVRREALLKLSLRLPDARRVRIRAGGHALHDRQARVVARVVTAFVEGRALEQVEDNAVEVPGNVEKSPGSANSKEAEGASDTARRSSDS